jgi:hypothetical protein
MNWFTDPAQICATLDMNDKHGLAEAIMIAISSLKDADGKLLRVRLSESVAEEIDFTNQIADTLLRAKKIRDERQLQQE